MPRKPKPSVDEAVSLFPFMSILACLIGVLMLMIAAVTLSQIGRDAPTAAELAAEAAEQAARQAEAEAARAREAEFRRLTAERKATEAQLPGLTLVVSDAAALRKELDAAKAARVAAEKQNETRAAALRTAQAAAEQAARSAARAAELRAELETLANTLQDREALLARLQEQAADLKDAPLPTVRVRPGGSGARGRAAFVECAGASVVLHDGPEPLRVPTAELAKHPRFAELLEQVKQRDDGSVVFLVRPDGVGTYFTARNIAKARFVPNGKLPIAGQGALDLSLVKP